MDKSSKFKNIDAFHKSTKRTLTILPIPILNVLQNKVCCLCTEEEMTQILKYLIKNVVPSDKILN